MVERTSHRWIENLPPRQRGGKTSKFNRIFLDFIEIAKTGEHIFLRIDKLENEPVFSAISFVNSSRTMIKRHSYPIKVHIYPATGNYVVLEYIG